MGGCVVRNDERTQVSQVEQRSGRDECILCISKHSAEVAMFSSSDI